METSHAPTRVSTGTEGLDEVLHGGLIAGRLYLIEGDPGAGKTTLALRYLLEGLERGERGLYVTLSESADELRAGAASHGWSLDGIDIVELESGLEVQSELTMFHPSEIELGETTQRVLQAVERVQPHRMVLDSLSELRLLAQSSLRYRRQILALKQYFSGQNCTVVLLDDCTAEGPDMQLQSIAHGVISLKQTSPLYGAAVRQLRVIKFRGSDFISGSQDLAITRGGLQVYPRLTAAEHGTAFEPETVPSGVVALDQLLGGGIDRGTSTLVIGPAGAGKSTVAMRYAIAAAERGAHAAVFAFEESRALLLRRLSGLGFPLNEGVGPGQLMVRQIDATQVLPSQFSSMVRTSVERDGARVIVIDSLNGYLNAMPEERALTIQLHELLSYLNNHGVATFLVAAQVGMLGLSGRGPVDASYLADAVVMLRLYEHQGMLKRAISVTKKRSGAHEETIRQLWFNSAGVHLGPPLKHLRGVLSGVPVELVADAFVTTQTDLAHGG